ncbi:sigma-70 family RNA polymerase sigma factor [Gluconacetobacter entanii]|uniref:RNA polymerase sigma factor n=1 Tax=Gluconacetobacter entanii TaxID=108528 RepID=A0ABT3K9E3_9PROT|nr:sigma-70 family RNA polymerase sigma factor [Gluconacetobacter entanii]MCE2580009.1 sigma-70 family RNA polymerase sigma factor [Komagataeibacter sp. FNDCR1]MCW4582209.1 sigma-70 family RNA polymerase sigma factor [Gluconacetobacter entanii]MCW4585432.1 sigma-70 family RNA polymerase sigma factor [Gluconacetobacter entanii]MCW4588607.1 sigma-70 family RNA polymerase sigma factor [Gluconacetobacter entanii]MCW4592046.1 sigma-70 family RNA polymerase sigma factor [Gluconacetobacter entanii]
MSANSQTVTQLRKEIMSLLPQLRGFARFLTGEVSSADDLVQETVLRALAALEQFQPGTNLRAWLYTIARNLFYETARRRRRERDVMSDYAASPDLARADAPASRGDDLRDLDEVIWRLTPRLREALLLVGVQEMTYAEAAEVCGVSVGTLKARVSRARAQIMAMVASAPDGTPPPDPGGQD